MTTIYGPYFSHNYTYWDYIFVFKFEYISYLFSLKNSRPCRDLNPGPPGTKPICYQLSYPGLDYIQIVKIEITFFQLRWECVHLADFIVEWLEKTSEKDCHVYEQLWKTKKNLTVPENGPIILNLVLMLDETLPINGF